MIDWIICSCHFERAREMIWSRQKHFFSGFDSGLRRHILWEEEILFPAFDEQTGMKESGPTFVMRMEHVQIIEFINQISDKLQERDIQTDNAENGLIRLLTSHNQKEETILYPWIDRTLSENEVTEMIQRMENADPK